MVKRFVEVNIDLDGVEISPDKLAQARERAGYEPADAAEALKCTTAHLTAVEKGVKRFSANRVARACILYNVDIRAIVNGVTADTAVQG
jgi:transcriptional regulator with XRE-family HTH domain